MELLTYTLGALALAGVISFSYTLGKNVGKSMGRSSLKNDLKNLTVRKTLDLKRNNYLNI